MSITTSNVSFINLVFAVFFIGEYLERPDDEKSFWKAGVTVRQLQGVSKKLHIPQKFHY